MLMLSKNHDHYAIHTSHLMMPLFIQKENNGEFDQYDHGLIQLF